MSSIDSFLRYLAECSPERFVADLPMLADWLEERGHPLAERVRAAKPAWPQWTDISTESELRRYLLARYRESFPDDRLHHVAVADRLWDGSFRWQIEADDGEDVILRSGWRSLYGVEPSPRDVNKTVQAILANLDATFGLAMFHEARNDLQADVLRWFGWRAADVEQSSPAF